MVPRTKVPSWERMFQGTNSLGNEYSSIRLLYRINYGYLVRVGVGIELGLGRVMVRVRHRVRVMVRLGIGLGLGLRSGQSQCVPLFRSKIIIFLKNPEREAVVPFRCSGNYNNRCYS